MELQFFVPPVAPLVVAAGLALAAVIAAFVFIRTSRLIIGGVFFTSLSFVLGTYAGPDTFIDVWFGVMSIMSMGLAVISFIAGVVVIAESK